MPDDGGHRGVLHSCVARTGDSDNDDDDERLALAFCGVFFDKEERPEGGGECAVVGAVQGSGLRPRTAFLLEPLGARTRPPRLRVVLVPAPCPCPGVPLLVCYSHLARALLVANRACATLRLLLLVRYS